jgi:hypothetical protein
MKAMHAAGSSLRRAVLWSTSDVVAVLAAVNKEWATVILLGGGVVGRASTDASASRPPGEGLRSFACSRAPWYLTELVWLGPGMFVSI